MASDLPGVTVSDLTVEDEVYLNVNASVTTQNSVMDPLQANNLLDLELADQGFTAQITSAYISPVPTELPSLTPSTSIPSAQPSITGHVGSLVLSSTVTEDISQDQIDSLTRYIAQGTKLYFLLLLLYDLICLF